MATIQKANDSKFNGNVAILCYKLKPSHGLSKEEFAYLKKQVEEHSKKSVSFNRLTHKVFFFIADQKKEKAARYESIRKMGNELCGALNSQKADSVLLIDETGEKDNALAFAEGLSLGSYQFLYHRKNAEKEKNSLNKILLYCPRVNEKDIVELNSVIDATKKARDLVNQPVNILNSEGLAEAFQKMGKQAGIKVEVFNKQKIESLKMGGLLAVNKGSVDPPTFTIMEYKPSNAKNKKPFVLVGKGLVYDTGGLSLKPTANSMDSMKCDMAGGAAVGCAIYAIAKAKLPVHVIALIPSTDNRPGFNAFAPGDIITMHDGSTVEMLNSDAEGRMILADALSYAKKYEPRLVMEFSTLTGAAAAAIGPHGIVIMGNVDEKTKEKLKASGSKVHERLAEFPFWEDYDELLKSDIADMKNIGGAVAGAITAGRFLVKYTNYPYMHFDIAGPAFINGRDGYKTKGGTGVGVRLLFDYFKSI